MPKIWIRSGDIEFPEKLAMGGSHKCRLILCKKNGNARQKSVLPFFRKISNVSHAERPVGMDTMTPRIVAIGLTLIFGHLLPEGLRAQTPAAISYGSIAPAESSTALGAQYAPILVAQNTLPAQIAPISNTPAPLSTVSPSVLPPFDPYATPAQTTWFDSILSVGNSRGTSIGQSPPSGIYSGNFDRFVPETYEAMRRFRDATSFEYTHLPRGGKENGFGMDEIDLRMQLAFPCRFIPDNGKTGFLYVAPSGSLVWWNGPAGLPDMSPNGFGAFVDVGMQPQFNETFGLIAWGRVGIFSDFENVSSDAFRFQGRLEGVVNASPQIQVHGGVIYYGRSRVKMLPTGGVVWRPDDDWVLKLIFPNPKVSRRLWTGPQADWWGYVHMDYAGGSWDISGLGLTDYNDVRLGMGVEFAAPNQMGGYVEFGGSFARELYSNGHRWANLPSVLYLKTGIIF